MVYQHRGEAYTAKKEGRQVEWQQNRCYLATRIKFRAALTKS